jgi:hypothetical protein
MENRAMLRRPPARIFVRIAVPLFCVQNGSFAVLRQCASESMP